MYGHPFALLYDAHWSDFPTEASRAMPAFLQGLGIDSGLVVDIGCGCGHVASTLCDDGYDVIGIDASEAMLDIAADRAPGATFVASPLELADLPSGASAVVATFDVLNYVLEPQDLLGLFSRVRRSLVPMGGAFVMDMLTCRGLQKSAGRTVLRKPGAYLVNDIEYRPDSRMRSTRMRGFIDTPDGPWKFDETHRQRGYPSTIVEDMLMESGLVPERTGGYSQRLQATPWRMFYTARR